MKILFTCAGRRNYLLRYFKQEIGNDGEILAADMSLTAPAMQEADKCFQVAAVTAASYIEEILDICKTNHVNLVISLNDIELPILSKERDRFAAVGACLLISSPQVIDICFDKLLTASFLDDHGFPNPATFTDINVALKAIENKEVSFPLFVKPRWGSASLQLYQVHEKEELLMAFKLASIQLQRSFLKVSDKLVEESILIQSGLPGSEYGIDILNDYEGNVREVYVKKKLGMRAGETEKSILVDEPVLTEIGRQIGAKLGHIGNLDCDVFYDGKNAAVLEMNPRFGGGYPFSHTLGANYPRAIIQWSLGNEFDTTDFEKVFNQTVAKCDNLLMVTAE